MSQISIRPFSTSPSNDIRIRATEDTSTPRKADELPYPTSNRVRRREKEYEQVRENYGVDIRLLTPEKIEAVRTKYKLTSPAFASYWNHVNNNRHKKSNRDFERLKRNWKRSKPDAIIHNLTHWAMMREVQDIVPESEKVPVVTERNIEPDNEMEGEDSDSADLDHILDRAVSRVEVKKPDPAWDWNRNTFTTANPERSQNDNTEPPPLRGRRRNGNLRLHWVGSRTRNSLEPEEPKEPSLPHLTSTGSAHMVSVSEKRHTTRTAIAVGTVFFSTDLPLRLITNWALKKGDVLSVSRIAGIMAVKKCSDIIPLCHPIPITHVSVELKTFPPDTSNEIMRYGGVMIESKVECTGPTGVEMEALTGVMAAALSVVDMCKAADKAQRIGEVRVVKKVGGRSGVFVEKGWESWQDGKVRDLLGRVVEPPN